MERTCGGGCTVCCKVVAVRELDKPQDQWCEHCTPGTGCNIYGQPSRPQSCGAFRCLWLQFELPEELKPDKSHVVLGATEDGVRIQAWVDKHYPEAYKTGKMGKFLEGAVQHGMEIVVILGNERKMLTTDTRTVQFIERQKK